MVENTIAKTNKSDFRSSIPNYSDEEILVILKKRKQYQPEAAELAVQEAIKRRLINSEQDLFSEKFQEKPSKFRWFPIINDDKNNDKIRKSIARVLLITGAVPTVWGVLEISKSVSVEGVLLVILGAVWIYISVQLMRVVQERMVNLLFILLAAAVAYIVKLFIGMKGLVVMDFVIPGVLFLFITYGLLFIRRLK